VAQARPANVAAEMCGRFSLTNPGRLPSAFPQFQFGEFDETRLPRFNIAPSQGVLGVRNDGRAVAEPMTWGIRGRINIRAESIAARRGPVRRRCIEFADGFYEWRERQPVYYTLRSGEPFAFAGLWDEGPGGRPACDVITCEPNALVAQVHDRMPVILPPAAVDLWLSPDALPPEIAAVFLKPYDPAEMSARAVSTRLNDARYDAPDVLRADEPSQQRLDL
jgi:putative SOS response-associated peptidase YedK